MIIKILELFLTAVAAYLIGSISTGYLIVKSKTGQDIRTIGSGSTGATNVKRVLGKKWFFIVLLLDAFKGALPVILAKLFISTGAGLGLAPVIAETKPDRVVFGGPLGFELKRYRTPLRRILKNKLNTKTLPRFTAAKYGNFSVIEGCFLYAKANNANK